MTNEQQHILVDLDDSDLALSDPAEDLRGWLVVDRAGDEVGHVDGLLVDEGERRARFLQVGSGGFLGLGKKTRLIPTSAVVALEGDVVAVDTTRDLVASAPSYDPTLEEAPYPDYSRYYAYYGLPTFWAPGYLHPPLPQEPPAQGQRDREGSKRN